MYEKLRGRVGRIISAGVSSIISAIEGLSPEAIMEEAIREIDDAAQEVQSELDRVLAAKHMAKKRLDEKNIRHRELDDQIAEAVDEGRDDLAETGIAHQLDIEAQLPILNETIGDLEIKEKELHSFASALAARKREMCDELAKLRAAKTAAPSLGLPAGELGRQGPGDVAAIGRKANQASSAFERMMSKESGLPLSMPSISDQAKLAELDKFSRGNRIKERLAAVKAAKKD